MSHHRFQRLAKRVVLLSFFLCCKYVFCQRYYNYSDQYADNAILIEVGGGIGFINCLTDLGGNKGEGKKFIKDVNWQNTQLCGSGYIGLVINDALGIRVEASFGRVKAYDSILSKNKTNSSGRYYRNLNFESTISEFAIVGEIHPLLLKDYGTDEPPRLSPYLLAGFGKFSFNPQTYFQGKWIDLHPLRLEGQGFKEYKERQEYRLSANSYPVGIGMRYEINILLFARFEIIHRFTNTDYLDDVSQTYVYPALFQQYLSPANAVLATQLSNRQYEINPNYHPAKGEQRGRSENNDAYFTINFKIGLLLGRKAIR